MDPVRDWTVLVYMNDNNNLCRGAQAMLKHQLGALEPCDRVQIGVEYSHLRERGFTNPDSITHRRAVVGQNKLDKVEKLPVADMASPDTIADFLRWGIRAFPARHYAVIFQSHGGAWRASMPDEAAGAAKYGRVDEPFLPQPCTTVSLPVLEQTLRQVEAETGVKPDVLAFDSCLMGNVEAAYQMRDRAGLLIASEDIISSTPDEHALDYAVPLKPILQRLSDRLAAGESPSARDLAHDWIEACASSWTTPTQSAFDLAGMKDVAGAVDRMAGGLLEADPSHVRDVVGSARNFSEKKNPDRFTREYDYKVHLKDLRDLAEHVLADRRLEQAWPGARDVVAALERSRVAHQAQSQIEAVGRTSYGSTLFSKTETYDAEHTHGLSVFIPDNAAVVERQRKDGDDYGALAFAADTRWSKVMTHIAAAPRG